MFLVPERSFFAKNANQVPKSNKKTLIGKNCPRFPSLVVRLKRYNQNSMFLVSETRNSTKNLNQPLSSSEKH